ncbi:membrane protein insertase YidC [uncultured Corynebacterium sp.]|uniref:membrane protein insertase YidC n=1 Tax=uncultured Corynebacterium sp. TaxID=159447 RepID=UPI0025E9D24D|nr:membrane protein insertase YidC [uncultured Corynebacterium sp.]
MFEPLVYAISGILKAWHLAVAAVPGVSVSAAWTASVILLLITVRTALLPFAYRQLLMGRKTVNLRPEFTAIKKRWSRSADPMAPQYQKWAMRELREKHGISAWAGIIPPLVQIPVFIGLFRMLRRMAGAGAHGPDGVTESVGFLSGDEVREFASAQFAGIPLPAYPAMSAEEFAELGTTFGEVIALCLPLIIAAAAFTGINMAISINRLRRTLDHGSRFMRGTYKYLIAVTGFAVAFPLLFGLFGPASLAIIVYWVCNNLWTMTQNAVITIILERRHPLTPEFRALRDQVRDARRGDRDMAKRHRREARASRRRALVGTLRTPSARDELWAAHRAMLAERESAAKAARDRELQQQMKVRQVRQLARLLRPVSQGDLPTMDGSVPVNSAWRRSGAPVPEPLPRRKRILMKIAARRRK